MAPTTTVTVLSDVAVEEFRSCLADRGIVIEEVPIDATGHPRLDLVMVTLDFSDPATADAVSACSEHLETGALDIGEDDVLREQIDDDLLGCFLAGAGVERTEILGVGIDGQHALDKRHGAA